MFVGVNTDADPLTVVGVITALTTSVGAPMVVVAATAAPVT
jgi:hypothetical protein